ncbi:unnamed protein product [Phytomonas sp. EM1]|nr:unnamed protein product [Phytomonas sp. EM1]|eukprot:CCW61431.1 unnamed protein product [Phytomonas sp. isolate EM1]
MAVVLHTTYGDLPILLNFTECPRTCYNFLALCASGYYNKCRFYRHIPGVLLQTGDPINSGKGGSSIFARYPATASSSVPTDSETGSGNPRKTGLVSINAPQSFFEDEGFGLTFHRARGVLSMAHKGARGDTNASQFFILSAPQPGFDGMYTAFGQIDLLGCYNSQIRQVVDGNSSSSLRSGEDVLKLLEDSAKANDKYIVNENNSVCIIDTTVLYNPFAEGSLLA